MEQAERRWPSYLVSLWNHVLGYEEINSLGAWVTILLHPLFSIFFSSAVLVRQLDIEHYVVILKLLKK